MIDDSDISRRELLRLGALGGAALLPASLARGAAVDDDASTTTVDDDPSTTTLAPPPRPFDKRNFQPDRMAYAALGRTRLVVSRLALAGTPWNEKIAGAAIDRGVNLVQGSIYYGGGSTIREQGQTLKSRKNKVFFLLLGRVNRRTVDTALTALGLERIDLLCPAVYSTDDKVNDERIRESFARLKQAGKVRHLGLAIHTHGLPDEIAEAAAAAGFYDVIFLMHQPRRETVAAKPMQTARVQGLGTIALTAPHDPQMELDEKVKAQDTLLKAKGGIDAVCQPLTTPAELKAFSAAASKHPLYRTFESEKSNS